MRIDLSLPVACRDLPAAGCGWTPHGAHDGAAATQKECAMNSMASSLASVDVLGIRVDDITAPNLLDLIESSVCNGQRLMVLNSNIHLINLAFDRPWLRQLFAKADIAFCDGAGVQFAVWGLTGCKPSRHTPPEWIVELAQRLARRDGTVYWLGGRPEVVSTAAARLEQATGLRT